MRHWSLWCVTASVAQRSPSTMRSVDLSTTNRALTAVALFARIGTGQPGIVFARGSSVAILVVLMCEGQEYTLLTYQPRVLTDPLTDPLAHPTYIYYIYIVQQQLNGHASVVGKYVYLSHYLSYMIYLSSESAAVDCSAKLSMIAQSKYSLQTHHARELCSVLH